MSNNGLFKYIVTDVYRIQNGTILTQNGHICIIYGPQNKNCKQNQ